MNIFARLASFPLRWKIGLLAVIGIILMAALTISAISAYDALAQPAAAALTEVVGKERVAKLNQLSAALTTLSRRLANDSAVRGSLIDAVAQQRNIDTLADALDALRGILNQQPTIRQLHLTTPDGQVILAVPDIGDNDDRDAGWFSVLSAAPLAGDNVHVDLRTQGETPVVDVVAPVVGESGLAGYVVVSVDPVGQAQSTDQISLYGSLATVNYANGSVVLYLVDNDAAATIDSPFSAVNSSGENTAAAVQVLTSRFFTRAARLTSPLTGQTTFLYAAPVLPLGKWLVAESRTVQVAAASDFSQFILPQIGLVALGIALLGLYLLFLENTIMRPVNALGAFARRVAEGRDLGKVQPVVQRDEIGQISESLNIMSTQLFQNVQALQIQLAESVRDIEATREIGQIISSLRDLDALLARIVDLIRQRFPHIYHAQVFLIDERGEYAELRVATAPIGEDPDAVKLRPHRILVGSRDLIGRVTGEGRPLSGTEGTVMPFPDLPETRAELVLPLRNKADVIGALDLHSQQPDAFAEEDLRLFQSVADQLAIAIVNAQLFEESQARLREIETLNRQFLGEAWRNYSISKQRTHSVFASDQWSDLQRQALETGTMMERVNAQERIVTFAIPILLRGVTLGVVECDMPADSYNDNVRQLALELTNRLAITADNARLFEQTVRATEREALINEISSKLTQQTDVSEILQIAVRELGQALRVPQTAIRLSAPSRRMNLNRNG